MKFSRIIFAVLLLVPFSLHAQEPAVVLSAVATSSSGTSTPIPCLLNPNCQGSWQPGSADSGTDDGIYLQFEKPIDFDYIEVGLPAEANTGDFLQNFRLYLNGKTRNDHGAFATGTLPNNNIGFGILNNASGTLAPLQENVKSVYIKIDSDYSAQPEPLRIKYLRFLKKNSSGGTTVIPLVLPKPLPAQVTATSILEPTSAYHPANLFDSKYDFAWSTNGKKNDGRGESFNLTLQSPQNIAGLIVWNGYQRSEEHFKANGRVLELEVQAEGQPAQKLKLGDQMEPQKLYFSPPLLNASKITFTIRDIIPGSTYKDVLLSELRLISINGELITPATTLPTVTAPPAFQGLINRSFSSFLHQPATNKEEAYFSPKYFCDNGRIRLRDNGTFVIYKDFNYGKADSAQQPTNINANVMEGNWEPKENKLRIFGRKYVTALQESEYLQGGKPSAPRTQIFQSEVEIKAYKDMSPAEKQALFAFLWGKKQGPTNKTQYLTWRLRTRGETSDVVVEGANYDQLVKKLDPVLQKLNPIYLSSSVLTDLLLPSDGVYSCVSPEGP